MEEPKFESWAIVEVMGHKRFAGHVTEQAFGSASMLRIDVPEIDGVPAFSKLIGIGSIYAITPCTEQTAREAQKSFRVRPFAMFELPMLPPPHEREEDWDDE